MENTDETIVRGSLIKISRFNDNFKAATIWNISNVRLGISRIAEKKHMKAVVFKRESTIND